MCVNNRTSRFYLVLRIIAKGAGGGLGSGGVSSSRGAIISSVIELHKDEEIYILVGQNGEHACIKSMGLQDASCATENKYSETNKVKDILNIYIENGAGGGGGASFVFLVRKHFSQLKQKFQTKISAQSSEQSGSVDCCRRWRRTWNWPVSRR